MKYAEIVILYYNKVKRFHENCTKKIFKDTRIVISLPWGILTLTSFAQDDGGIVGLLIIILKLNAQFPFYHVILRERLSATVSIPYSKQVIIIIRHSERSPGDPAEGVK